VVIQQIKHGSIAEQDGRLEIGDHIVKLNGIDLSINTHKETADLFAKTTPTCKMTIYRDSLNENEDQKSNFTEGTLNNNRFLDRLTLFKNVLFKKSSRLI
jgi:hypothetical protein